MSICKDLNAYYQSKIDDENTGEGNPSHAHEEIVEETIETGGEPLDAEENDATVDDDFEDFTEFEGYIRVTGEALQGIMTNGRWIT